MRRGTDFEERRARYRRSNWRVLAAAFVVGLAASIFFVYLALRLLEILDKAVSR